MASLAKLGKGTILRRGGLTSPETYNPIPEILEISALPGGTPDIIDVTNHDSVGLYREELTGLITLNEMVCRANYIADAEQTALRDDMEAGTVRYYEIVLPSVGGDETVRFQARVRAWTVNPQIAAQQILEFTLKPSGAPVWT